MISSDLFKKALLFLMRYTKCPIFSLSMFVRLLMASDWLKYTHNLSNTIKLILLDSLLQDDTAGAIIRVVFFYSIL